MTGYPNTELMLTKETGEIILAQRDEYEKVHRTTQKVTSMLEADVVTSYECDKTKIIFRNTKEDDDWIYAQCEYLVFQGDNVAYIEWIEVDKELQNNGIGQTLIEEMVNEIDRYSIYSKISNVNIISVAIDQKFRKIRDGRLKG